MTAFAHQQRQQNTKSATFIHRAVETADLNALRIALLQVTGDETFASIRVEQVPINGGSASVTAVRGDDREKMVALARRYLESPLNSPAPPVPSEVRRLLELYADRPVTDDEFRLALEQLAFPDPEPADHSRLDGMLPDDFHVLIIGAGFGGVASAIHLGRLGIPYTMLDRQPGIGGTWVANRYPDVRVDIPSHFYQFTFEKNYPWKHRFAQGAEVREYIEHVAEKYGVDRHFCPCAKVTAAHWDDATKRWQVHYVRGGESHAISVNAIISAAGLFNRPLVPKIKGLDAFTGHRFHTTDWPEGLDITGKRLAVIGTGSTGSQLVPKIAQTAEHVTVFQRTPNWVAPVAGYHDEITAENRWLLDTVPYYWNWFSFGPHWLSTQNLPKLQVHDPEWQAAGGIISERNDRLRDFLKDYIRDKLQGDEELIAKCTPDYAPWTRRMVMDNGWYDALLRDNVDLVTSGIDHIDIDAVVDGDGVRHPADIVVLSTGFATEDYLWPVDYVGRDGLSLGDAWRKDGARAHMGLTLPGFPNLFVLYGPNGQPRSGAITKWLELWARYAVDAIITTVQGGHRSVEVSKERHDAYNAAMDRETKQLIWESAGKSSYYVNSFGRSSVNMPWTAEHYFKLSGVFDPADYHFQ